MSGSDARTGAGTVRLRGMTGITGQRAATQYSADAYDALLDRAPLPSPQPERLERWTDKLAGTPALDLLSELHDRFGLEWQRIARLLGVSVPALNKWRVGGGLAPETDVALRRLVAFSELLTEAGIGDVAAWFASHPVPRVPFTRADIFSVGGSGDLLASVHDDRAGELLLDRWLPRWREAASAPALFRPRVRIDDDGSVIVSIGELPGVLAVGDSIEEARRRVLEELRDYAADWDSLREAPNHSGNQARVDAILRAEDEAELYQVVFGEP